MSPRLDGAAEGGAAGPSGTPSCRPDRAAAPGSRSGARRVYAAPAICAPTPAGPPVDPGSVERGSSPGEPRASRAAAGRSREEVRAARAASSVSPIAPAARGERRERPQEAAVRLVRPRHRPVALPARAPQRVERRGGSRCGRTRRPRRSPAPRRSACSASGAQASRYAGCAAATSPALVAGRQPARRPGRRQPGRSGTAQQVRRRCDIGHAWVPAARRSSQASTTRAAMPASAALPQARGS